MSRRPGEFSGSVHYPGDPGSQHQTIVGRALCGCLLGMKTPTTTDPSRVTCPSCRKKLSQR